MGLNLNTPFFSDSYKAGDTVVWQTANPIVLTGFNLFAAHDGDPRNINYRGFRTFTLHAKLNPEDDFQPIFVYTVQGDYYNPDYNVNGYPQNVLYLEVYGLEK